MDFKMKSNVLIIGILLMCNVLIAQEDTICISSCHCIRNLTPAGVMISHVHPKNEWMMSYRYMRMNHTDVLSGQDKVDEMTIFNNYLVNTTQMNMDMHMLMGMYGFSNRLTGMIMLNYLNNSMEMEMLSVDGHDHGSTTSGASSNHSMEMKSSGIGDVDLNLLYGIIKNNSTQLILNGGVSLPVGSIQILGKEDDMLYANQRLPYMMQLGSGNFDFSPGLTWVFQQNKFAISSQFSSVIRPFYNKVGYKLGNEYSVNLWGAYNWWNSFSSSIRIEGNFINNISGSDPQVYKYNEIGANPMNYGGKKAMLYLGLSYQFEKGLMENLRMNAEYGIPLYQNVNGLQNRFNQSLVIALGYSF